jgi:hypothetical protein
MYFPLTLHLHDISFILNFRRIRRTNEYMYTYRKTEYTNSVLGATTDEYSHPSIATYHSSMEMRVAREGRERGRQQRQPRRAIPPSIAAPLGRRAQFAAASWGSTVV